MDVMDPFLLFKFKANELRRWGKNWLSIKMEIYFVKVYISHEIYKCLRFLESV